MGNAQGTEWTAPSEEAFDPRALFRALDVSDAGYLTVKDLMDAPGPGVIIPRSLPALYFFDSDKNGRLVEDEFVALVDFCQNEKRKIEAALAHDKSLRHLILAASRAGVKDCSVHGRSSYRRLSSHANVRSVFSSRAHAAAAAAAEAAAAELEAAQASTNAAPTHGNVTSDASAASDASTKHVSDTSDEDRAAPSRASSVAMYSSQAEFDVDKNDVRKGGDGGGGCGASGGARERRANGCASRGGGGGGHGSGNDSDSDDSSTSDSDSDAASTTDADLLDPQNRTALDTAVVENVIQANIHKLADLLQTEGSREKFMAWLWELVDYNGSGVVTIEELRVFLAALSEDGIDVEELAFSRHTADPLDVSIINEFDTTHAGMLSRDEFMVLADLVTREYEFWQNRHLERIGDYELGRTIGRGSSGVVRLAMHVETRKKFAVKIIKKGKCSDLSRLDREIQSLMVAKHKYIVELEEVLDSENNIFLVMELCGGGSMVDIVRLYPEERMPEETARFFLRQVFEALALCHARGICHRDVRLDNLMLDNVGNVKITDFGHSGMFNPGWDLFSTALVGSVHNLSPEQILGQLYSGEKIDIWSAGVAVYCLLVGRPPFFEPEVNALLESITTCRFEIPDFVSSLAADMMRCMIRAVPEERIGMKQMLHHPWFYDGPEHGPSMDVVMFPVDQFFRKRPDIAEMIFAITIYQHSLHFHLADTHNPSASPEDQRGQDWTLKCLCPKNDIKFTVSLFTQSPHDTAAAGNANGLVSRKTSNSVHDSKVPRPGLDFDGSGAVGEPGGSTPAGGRRIMRRYQSTLGPSPTAADSEEARARRPPRQISSMEASSSRPPVQKKIYKVTPMDVAAHIRASAQDANGELDPFDFDTDLGNEEFAVQSFSEELLRGADERDKSPPHMLRGGPGRAHGRSLSLDESGGVRRINRSATVDAFPYQKVIPKRRMPESARKFNFDHPAEANGSADDSRDSIPAPNVRAVSMDGRIPPVQSLPMMPLTPSIQSETSLGSGDDGLRSPGAEDGERRSVIAQSLYRHPSKAVSPQVRRNNEDNANVTDTPATPDASGNGSCGGVSGAGVAEGWGASGVASGVSSAAASGSLSPLRAGSVVTAGSASASASASLGGSANASRLASANASANGCGSLSDGASLSDSGMPSGRHDAKGAMQPFIEVRLQAGESRLFLKICRKLKNICSTKLAAAAERQRKKTRGRRSLSTLRRTASARNLAAAGVPTGTESDDAATPAARPH